MSNPPVSRTSSWAASLVFALIGGLIAFGCGGAGSTAAGSSTGPTMRSSSLSGFQGMAGISGYVQRAVSASSPTTTTALATDGNGFDNMLGLYVGEPAASGATLTFTFFSDEARQIPAGTLVLTMQTSPWNRNFSAYPAVVGAHLDIDQGHHAGTGDFVITFLNSDGDARIEGDFHLEQNDIDVNLDLLITDGGTQISGQWSAAANGLTVHVTNLSGDVNGEWSGDIRIEPFGWTGTIVMNPQLGQYQATINSSQGPFTVSVNAAMTMTIHHGSTDIVIPNALGAPLASEPNGTGGGGNSGGLSNTGSVSSGGTTGSGGETNTTGQTNGTTGETTGETTGISTGSTEGSTSAGTTSSGTTGSTTTTGETGSTNGSTTAGTTSSGTTGSTTTTTTGETGSTNGSTTAGTTSSGTTGISTTGSTNGTTSAGTTGTTGGVTTGTVGSTGETGTSGSTSTTSSTGGL